MFKKKRLIGFEIVFHIMIWEGRKIDLEMDFFIYDIIKGEIILNIIILKRGFSNRTALFIILLSEV